MCLPKSSDPTTPADFRSITLLNTDYKIMARIIAYRLRPVMEELLHPSQFCGVPGRTIFEAIVTVREAIAQAEVTRVPLCVLSLDVQEAFDRISHKYLFPILRSYGFSDWFVERIKRMYEEAASSIQINGHISGSIPIHSSVRKGCPMSMLLFACVDPLLRILDQKLPGIRIGKQARKTVVVAYADNVTIFVTTPTDIPVIRDAIQCYEKATAARLKTRNTLNIPYQAEI